ncbi:MAG TPA: serine hydrolase domain-containing protein [Cyclobacteriaceae bacterium]|nr:beta-lactamase family protein [Cyclobacteriaceae bacterium]HMV09781.1 serine hydrolase domain-containing protein [Cyclobacteriaceae bacterium]HMX00509.1 serine hydrolase domain-containing protein [Cyclobacteriaceae bacterium]HMX51829.1 serine hydrolase domain-containing protein [Cyclobacteriaceae bacterium]HMY94941.1 serine hydrolase domain-containing protein [Cyclobacteriaceae bacterium]
MRLIFIMSVVGCLSLTNAHSQDEFSSLDEYIKSYESIGSFSGNILVAKNGSIILNKSFGMADYGRSIPNATDTRFYLGSNSKIFTAVGILILEEKGLLKTDDFVSEYLTDFPNGNKITIHQILSHTSGLPHDLPIFSKEGSNPEIWSKFRSLAEQIDLLREVELAAEPGSKVIYSNNNYRLLAYIIENVTGKSFGDFLQKEIFDVCGMKETGHDNSAKAIPNLAIGYFPEGLTKLKVSFKVDWSNKIGHASVYSTTSDMFKFYESLFGEKLLSKRSLEKLCSPHALSNVGTYGYGLFVFPDIKVYGFNGRSPGFSSEVRYYDQANKYFIVVLSNNYSAPVLRIMNKVASLAFGTTYDDIKIGQPIQLEATAQDAFIGNYEGGADFVMPNAKLEVLRKDDYLVIVWKLGGGRESILIPQADGSFIDKTFWATVKFENNDSNHPSKIIYTTFGKQYEAQKMK